MPDTRKAPEPEATHVENVVRQGTDAQAGGVIVLGPDLRVVSANQAASELLDIDAALLAKGTRWTDFVRFAAERGDYGEGGTDFHIARIIEMIEQAKPYEITRVRPDGALLEVVGIPLADGGFVSRQRDVTAERRRQQELIEARESRRRYKRFFEMSGELLGIAGPDGRLHTINDRWQRTLGWDYEALTERPFTEYVVADEVGKSVV